jgi:DNA-binding NarL/FixJ family response regulator
VFAAVATFIDKIPGNHVATGFVTLPALSESLGRGECYDLVLLDLGLPGFRGLSALEQYRKQHEATPVVVLSALNDQDVIIEALDMGAMGFIPKTSLPAVLTGAIAFVVGGGVYVPPEALAMRRGGALSSAQRERINAADQSQRVSSTTGPKTPVANPVFGLTLRQRQVLDLLLKGNPNKLICRQLNLSQDTVKTHLRAIFGRLGVNNRTEAVIAAHEFGVQIDYRRQANPMP